MRLFTMRSGVMVAAGAALFLAAACTDPNAINKTTYNGQTYTNTCQTFQQEVQAVIDANSGAQALRVAEEDNTGMDYTHLEPGQFEQRGDTLYFRLAGDLEYGKYLQKNVAVIVRVNYMAQDQLADLESDPQGLADSLIVTQAYYQANSNPYMVYRIPTRGKLNGKQISLSFSVVQMDPKTGRIRKVFCNTLATPLGPLEAPCCTDAPFSQARPRSVVMMPTLDLQPVSFRYRGFTGTLDLIFPMNSVKFDRKQLTDIIQNYIKKYEEVGYKVREINITGWASQGGTQALNQNLSDRRARVVEQDLRAARKKAKQADEVSIVAQGRGEDWERFDVLVKTAVFTDEERNQLLAISASSADPDEKEAQLRKLPFWNKLVKEVLTYNRHTFITFEFDYAMGEAGTNGSNGTTGSGARLLLGAPYSTQIPMISPELYNVATQETTVGSFQRGSDIPSNISTLTSIIENGNRTGNLFALRSTWHFGARDVNSAIADLEQAISLEPGNQQYPVAMLAYRTENMGNNNSTERLRLLNTYNDYVARYPSNLTLGFNRAVVMDRVGYISGALAEYDRLLNQAGRNAVGINNRGVARLKTNRVVEAESDFREALAIDPNLPEAHFNLAVVAAYKGLTDRAVQHLDQAVALRPELRSEVGSNPVFRVVRDNPKFAKYR